MRDLVLREALRTVAAEAGECFRELVDGGEEIPYEVREPGNGSPLCQYAPLTARFIRDHSSALDDLDSFGSAASALAQAELAGPYLEELDLPIPEHPGRRAETAIVAFLCRLWHDSSDFSLEDDRLEGVIGELEACSEGAKGEIDVVVPLVGLQLPITRLDLATATLVRADAVEVPAEARRGEGGGRAAWEPQFLAVASCEAPDPVDEEEGELPAESEPVAARFRRLVTSLRLFKPGGVALGPHAWIKGRGDRWRRVSTGAGASRPGGYRLAESELGDLVALSGALERRPIRVAALARAISRFEAGLERRSVLEALNDYLLALRFLLEGGGPATTALSMRVAALCAEPEERMTVRATVERALALERDLWSDDPATDPPDGRSPAEIANEVEDLVRAILKDAASGHLGGDLRATADEILLADGWAAGEGEATQRGGTSEWTLAADPDGVSQEPEDTAEEPEETSLPEPLLGMAGAPPGEPGARTPEQPSASEPTAREEIEPECETGDDMKAYPDWLREVGSTGETLDWPARPPALRLLDRRPEEREAVRSRVAGLFPRPETTEWNVRELDYERRRNRVRA